MKKGIFVQTLECVLRQHFKTHRIDIMKGIKQQKIKTATILSLDQAVNHRWAMSMRNFINVREH